MGVPADRLAAKVKASEQRAGGLEARDESKPQQSRRDARPMTFTDAPSVIRRVDPPRGRRDDAADLRPPIDASDLPPLDQPASARSTGGPMPLVTTAPELGSGGTAQP
jgi:hypothetical protein